VNIINRNDWNPELYLKFKNERIQPCIDLVSRINIENPEKIIDIGCGPGNSAQILAQKWPNSRITGIDNSLAMLEKAKNDYPKQEWKIMDAENMIIEEKYDIVFSNSTIQWIPDHKRLINNFIRIIENNGALAIQIPMYQRMPISQAIDRVSKRDPWNNQTKGCFDMFTFHLSDFYYDQLTGQVELIDLWETSYYHIMNSHEAIIEMIRSTGLKPYLNRLESEQDKTEFENEVLREIKKEYPNQKDGKVLFPFERLFFIAYI
jgi:trans-aconitate 2-methyltransferase